MIIGKIRKERKGNEGEERQMRRGKVRKKRKGNERE